MSSCPNNTVAQFVTKLPQTIELDGVWDVVLMEISFPIRLPNVLPNTCSFTVLSPALEPVTTYTLEWGYYEYIGQLTQKINEILREYVACSKSQDSDGKFSVKFNDALERMLGFTHLSTETEFLDAHCIETVQSVAHSSTNDVQHVVLGDVMAPLLHIVDVKTVSTSVKHQILNPPLYMPLLKQNFDTIETDEGLPFPFVDRKLVVVLELKRRIVDGLL